MNIVACPKCAAQFDVSTFQPGSTFVCGSCGNVLKVPSAAAPQAPGRAAAPQRPAAPPQRGPKRGAPQRGAAPGRPAAGRSPAPGRGGAGRRPDPRRAGAVPAAAPGAPAGRPPSGGRRAVGGRKSGYERPEKSKTPLVIGGVGAVVVIIALIAIIAFTSGNGDKGYGDNGGQNVANNGGAQEPAGPTKAEIQRKLKGRVYNYGKDTAQLYEVYKEAKKEGFSGIMQMAAEAALKEDEDLDWANLHFKKVDLQTVYDRIPKNDLLDVYQNDAYKKLREMEEFEPRWATSSEYEKAEEFLKEAIAHGERLRTDQSYVDIWVIRQNVALHPFYSEFPYSVKSDYPYVVFVQTEAEGKEHISDKIVGRNVRILKRLYEEFHNVFGKRFDLPQLEDMKIPSERTLKVFALANEKKFHEYQNRIGQPLPGGVRAYYKPSDQWITLFEGGQWEKRAKKGESSFNINKIFHEGTHQLMHVYTKILMERALNKDITDPKNPDYEEVPWTGRGVHSKLHWFQEGFAELFAASKPVGDSWDLMQMHRNRLEEWKGCRKAKKDEWPFETLIKIPDRRELMRKGMEIGLHPMEAGRLSSLFYAQAWVLCHYLWYGDDGKHREKFLEYMGMELSGKTGYKYWVKVWGSEEWGALGKKVDAHFDELCEEMGVR